jgi:hypothetical protein
VRSIKVLLHQNTPKWAEWRQQHVQALPQLQSLVLDLEQSRLTGSAAERWISGNHLRYIQRPLHHLGKDMIDGLRAGGPLPEHHASEMEALENRGSRRPVLWGAAEAGPVDTLLDLLLAGASFELCVRRLILHVMLRSALSEAQLTECFGLLLDAFGHQHIATLTNLEAAGFLVHKVAGQPPEADSSLAAMRVLLDKVEANQRNQKDTLALSAIILPAPGDDAVTTAATSPYGRYRPVSALLVKSAMRRYMPEWVKVRPLDACPPSVLVVALLLHTCSQHCRVSALPSMSAM